MSRWQITVFRCLNTALLTQLKTLVDVTNVNCLQLELLTSLLCSISRLIIISFDKIASVWVRCGVTQWLLQCRVRQEYKFVIHIFEVPILITNDQTVVSFPLQVMLDLNLTPVLGLILHDCKKLLSLALILFRIGCCGTRSLAYGTAKHF